MFLEIFNHIFAKKSSVSKGRKISKKRSRARPCSVKRLFLPRKSALWVVFTPVKFAVFALSQNQLRFAVGAEVLLLQLVQLVLVGNDLLLVAFSGFFARVLIALNIVENSLLLGIVDDLGLILRHQAHSPAHGGQRVAKNGIAVQLAADLEVIADHGDDGEEGDISEAAEEGLQVFHMLPVLVQGNRSGA